MIFHLFVFTRMFLAGCWASEKLVEPRIDYFLGWWPPLDAATASNTVFSMKDTMLLCTKGTNFTIFHADNIVSSACRYRIIRAFRAKGFLDNRVISLSISYHSCLLCNQSVLNDRVIGLPISPYSSLAKPPRTQRMSP